MYGKEHLFSNKPSLEHWFTTSGGGGSEAASDGYSSDETENGDTFTRHFEKKNNDSISQDIDRRQLILATSFRKEYGEKKEIKFSTVSDEGVQNGSLNSDVLPGQSFVNRLHPQTITSKPSQVPTDILFDQLTFVSLRGTDTQNCGGALASACRSLSAAVSQSKGNLRIVLISNKEELNWAWLCEKDPILIRHSVIIESGAPVFKGGSPNYQSNPLGTRTYLGCPGITDRLLMFNISGSLSTSSLNGSGIPNTASTTTPRLAFVGLHLVRVFVLVGGNVNVSIISSELEDCLIKSNEATTQFVDIEVRDSVIGGRTQVTCAVNCETTSELDLQGSTVKLSLINSTLRHTKVGLQLATGWLVNQRVLLFLATYYFWICEKKLKVSINNYVRSTTISRRPNLAYLKELISFTN